MGTVIDELDRLPERIEASRDRIIDLNQQLKAELKIRNDLVVQACDHAGLTMARVAKHAGVSQPQVTRILAGASYDD